MKAGTYVGFDLRTDGTAAAPIKFSAQLGVVVNAPNPRTGVDGINVEGADFAVIDGFKVANQSRTGIRVVGGTGDTVSRNVVYGTVLGGNAGIFLDGASSARVQNNLVYNNHTAGIALAHLSGATGSVNAVLVNNTVSVPTDGGWALDISGGSTGATVFNNILQTAHATRGTLSITTDSLLAFVSDYNTVADRFSADGGATVQTLAQWQAATGQDAHSVIGTVASTFVSPGANNYQLSMLSPARDMGKRIEA